VIGLHDKPVGMFDVVVGGVSYWGPLLSFLDHALKAGFVREAARELPIVDDDAGRLLDRIGVLKA
jgi:predicted Rossmann-fold nucleotide-binding protein